MEEKILAAFLPAKDRFEKLDFVLGTSSAPSRVNRDSREDFEVPSDALHDSIITVDFNPSAPTRASNRGLKPQMSQSSSFESTAVTIDHGGIPYALKLCGFYFGIVMLILVAYLVDQSVIMLISCGIKKGIYDYEELSQHLLGDYGYYATTIFMFIFAYGAQIAYMVIIGDTIPTVLADANGNDDDVPSREIVMSMFATIIILPLCLLKHLSSLSKTSSFSVLSDFVIVAIIMSNSIHEGKRQGIDVGLYDCSVLSSTVFAGIGTISFAFVCQHNSFIVFKSLKTASLDNWRSVTHISVAVSFFLSLLLGTVGYLSFKEHTQGDILSNFSATNDSIDATRVFLAICMTFVFPMECYVSRHCVCSIIDKLGNKKYLNGAADNSFTSIEFSVLHSHIMMPASRSSDENIQPDSSCANSPAEFPTLNGQARRRSEDDCIVRSCVSLFLWGSSLSIAIFSGNLGTILALTGALAASFLGFVIPGALYIKAHESHFQQVLLSFKEESDCYEPNVYIRLTSFKEYIIPSFMIIFGGVLCLSGIFTILSA